MSHVILTVCNAMKCLLSLARVVVTLLYIYIEKDCIDAIYDMLFHCFLVSVVVLEFTKKPDAREKSCLLRFESLGCIIPIPCPPRLALPCKRSCD